MLMSIFGLLVFIVTIALFAFWPKHLFGEGGFKEFVIKLLAAKEVADIAFHNNKKNVPDFAKDVFSRFTGGNGGDQS